MFTSLRDWMSIVRLYTIVMLLPTCGMIWVSSYVVDSVRRDEGFARSYSLQVEWAGSYTWQILWALSAISLLHILFARASRRTAAFVIVGGFPVFWWTTAYWIRAFEAWQAHEPYLPVAALPAWSWWSIARLLLGISYLGASAISDDLARINDAIGKAAKTISRDDDETPDTITGVPDKMNRTSFRDERPGE